MRQGRTALKSDKPILLTEVELTLMLVVWRIGSATVKDVTAALPDGEKRKITTVATMLRILGEKGFLDVNRVERSLLYRPRITLVEYQKAATKELRKELFDGSHLRMFEACLAAFSFPEQELVLFARKLNERSTNCKRFADPTLTV